MATLGENVSRVVADFNAIKSAIEGKGIIVGNSPTSAYAEKIASIRGEDSLFKDMVIDNIESLSIPDGIRKIRNYCFYHWDSLKRVAIPDSVVEIYPYAFSRCNALESVTFGEGLFSISSFAFWDCHDLSEINFSTGLEIISANAFSNCYSIERLELPKTLVTIGSQAFCECRKLKYLYIPSGINSIDPEAFMWCTELENVILEDGFDNNELNFEYSNKLTREAILNMINALSNRSNKTKHTLRLGNTNLARLTDEDKAIATVKNWELI